MIQNNNAPLLSIVIPVYNTQKYVSGCIDSICAQKYSNIEILIVDDGSTDNSAEIIKEKIKTDKRIKYIYQNNKGVSAARNTGICNAEGEYITFVDSDDFIEKNTYFVIMQRMKKTDADAAIYAFCRVFNNGQSEDDLLPWEDGRLMTNYEIKSEIIPYMIASDKNGRVISGSVCRTIYKSNKINNIFFDESVKMQEDLLYCIKSYANMDNMLIINNVKYNYVKHESTTTEHYRVDFYEESKYFEECIINALREIKIFEKIKGLYWSKRITMYSLCISNLFREDSPENIKDELHEIVTGFNEDKYIRAHFHPKYSDKKMIILYLLLKLRTYGLIQIIYKSKEIKRRKRLSK